MQKESTMRKVKTSELSGAALDWAVSKCEWHREEGNWRGRYMANYSTDWAQGGPIIEREFIQFRPAGPKDARWWIACPADTPYWEETTEGPTPLIAAMRCFVASKLGDVVEIPE